MDPFLFGIFSVSLHKRCSEMDLGNITKSILTLIVTLNGTTGVVVVSAISREISVDLNTMKLDDTCRIQNINIRNFHGHVACGDIVKQIKTQTNEETKKHFVH